MYIGFSVVDTVVLALVIVLAMKYWRQREAGGRSGKWADALVAILLVISMAAFFLQPPTKGNWFGWLAHLGRLAIIWWLIMRD